MKQKETASLALSEGHKICLSAPSKLTNYLVRSILWLYRGLQYLPDYFWEQWLPGDRQWYQSSHLTLSKKANKPSHNVELFLLLSKMGPSFFHLISLSYIIFGFCAVGQTKHLTWPPCPGMVVFHYILTCYGLNLIQKQVINRFIDNEKQSSVGAPYYCKCCPRTRRAGGRHTGANALSYHMHWLQCVIAIDQCCLCGFTLWPPSLAPSTVSHLCAPNALLPPLSIFPFLCFPVAPMTRIPHTVILFLWLPLTFLYPFFPAVNHCHFTAVSAGFKALLHVLLPSFMSTMHLQVYKNLVVVV